MIKLTNDTSQWQTVTSLVDFLNKRDIEPNPSIIDIGAADGKLNSNSYPFIEENGWHGILVEPNPVAYKSLYDRYYDDGLITINAAIFENTGTMILNLPNNEADDQLASLVVDHPKKVEVKTLTVNDLFDMEEIPDGGVLSIDTEGYDHKVVEMWMDTSHRPEVIISESWPHMGYNNLQKVSCLKSNGYEKILHCGENEIFIKKDLL